MRKIVGPEGWDFDQPATMQIPVLRNRKLGSVDRKQLESRISGDMLAKFARLELPPGVQPVHNIALGCTEAFGPNRNGDGFREAVCREYHPTFVKSAKFFRGHKSGSRDPFYGTVKLSQYHEKMRRIELIAGLFSTKEAAAAYGSRARVADLELEKLAAAEPISTSMGCAVSHDICSHCFHKSATPKQYCTASACAAGGLSKHMGEVQPDGSILHADNPDPEFNDISYVKRGADRISFLMGVLQKSAAWDTQFIGGAALAELTYTPEYETKLSRMAADMSRIERASHQFAKLSAGCSAAGRMAAFNCPAGICDDRKLVQACAALADQNIILPADEFLQLLTGQKQAGARICAALPGVFDRLACPLVNPFACYDAIPSRYHSWAAGLAQDYSLAKAAVLRRIGIASFRGVGVMLPKRQKCATLTAIADEAAQQYALYVLATLDRNSRDTNLGLTATLSVLQNQI
jgi:hypothetical protein